MAAVDEVEYQVIDLFCAREVAGDAIQAVIDRQVICKAVLVG